MLQLTAQLRTLRSRVRLLAGLTGFAVVVALLTVPPSPAQAVVAADDVDCRDAADPVPRANAILAGRYALGVWPERDLGTNLTWTENPFTDDNWQSNLHGLRWVSNLLQAELSEQTGDYKARLYEILQDWEQDNRRPGAKSKWAWSDHPTAARGIVLACINDLLHPTGEDKTLVDRMLKKHGDTLLEDGFYVKYGNHAMDQSIALLEIGRVLNDETFMATAEDRLKDYVLRSVDTQGVMNEQSVFYQWFNYHRYGIAVRRLQDAGRDPGPGFDRVSLMPNFLAHATLPNGRYEMIGDTHDSPARLVPDTYAEYAATRGASGPKPPRTVARFNAGYLFARSAWGKTATREAPDQTFFATKWGPRPILHGHHDGMSLTLASWGSRLLLDSGLYKYGGGPFRVWMQSRAAHNVVTVDGATWRATAGSGRVIDNTLKSNKYVDIQLRTSGYPGVTHTRRITYSRALDCLIVDDQLSSRSVHTYRQLWHLGSDANPVIRRSHVYTVRPRGNVLIAQLYGKPTVRFLKGRKSPIQGWTAYQYAKLTPTPTAEVIQQGRSVRYLTLLVPAKNTPRAQIKALRVFPTGYDITLKVNNKTERLQVNGSKIYAVPLSG